MRSSSSNVPFFFIFIPADQCKITLESINNLVLLRNVVKEAIRLCCPIGAGFRKVIKTFVLGVGDLFRTLQFL